MEVQCSRLPNGAAVLNLCHCVSFPFPSFYEVSSRGKFVSTFLSFTTLMTDLRRGGGGKAEFDYLS